MCRFKKWALSITVDARAWRNAHHSGQKREFLKDIFEIANTLLSDQDDLVQKGIWLDAQSASRANPKEVFDMSWRKNR